MCVCVCVCDRPTARAREQYGDQERERGGIASCQDLSTIEKKVLTCVSAGMRAHIRATYTCVNVGYGIICICAFMVVCVCVCVPLHEDTHTQTELERHIRVRLSNNRLSLPLTAALLQQCTPGKKKNKKNTYQ